MTKWKSYGHVVVKKLMFDELAKEIKAKRIYPYLVGAKLKAKKEKGIIVKISVLDLQEKTKGGIQ